MANWIQLKPSLISSHKSDDNQSHDQQKSFWYQEHLRIHNNIHSYTVKSVQKHIIYAKIYKPHVILVSSACCFCPWLIFLPNENYVYSIFGAKIKGKLSCSQTLNLQKYKGTNHVYN